MEKAQALLDANLALPRVHLQNKRPWSQLLSFCNMSWKYWIKQYIQHIYTCQEVKKQWKNLGCCLKSHSSKIPWLFPVTWKELLSQMVRHKAGFCVMYCFSNVPRCQTLQKSFLDTFPVFDVNHWLFFFFFFLKSGFVHLQDWEEFKFMVPVSWKMNCPSDTGSRDIFAHFQSSVIALRVLWCYKQLDLSYWNILISSSPGGVESAFCLGFAACQDFFSAAVLLREPTFSLPSGLFGLNSLFVTSSSSLLCLLSWDSCS